MASLESLGETDYNVGQVSICLYSILEDDSEMDEAFEKIAKLNPGGAILNKTVDINSEDHSESEIGFGGKDVVAPFDSESNALIVDEYSGEELGLHIHMYTDMGMFETFTDLIDEIVNICGDTYADIFIYYCDLPRSFENLDMSIESDLADIGSETEFTGIRLHSDDYDYLLQSDASGENTTLRAATSPGENISEDSATFIENWFQNPLRLIEEIQP